jgi:hypothetical protein
MIFKISHIHKTLIHRAVGLCHQVHAAGTQPNSMNRFMLSNSHEVLFVN